jgi:ADP-ribose pyrophosphatase YjhB (NUDIX family)
LHTALLREVKEETDLDILGDCERGKKWY